MSKFVFNAKITDVYDADTVTVEFDLGFGLKYQGQKLRLYGINAFEVSLRGETTEDQKSLGKEGAQKVRDLILDKTILIETIKDSKGKYGRYLAKLWVPWDFAMEQGLTHPKHKYAFLFEEQYLRDYNEEYDMYETFTTDPNYVEYSRKHTDEGDYIKIVERNTQFSNNKTYFLLNDWVVEAGYGVYKDY